MKLLYLSLAILISLIIYWICKWAINKLLDKDESPKSFKKSIHQLFTDSDMNWVNRWILAENLLAIIISLCFITIIFYKGWFAGEKAFILEPNQLNINSFSIVVLSIICSIPLAFWVMRLLGLILLFTSFSMDFADVHWLKWIQSFFIKNKKKGCLWSILKLFQFVILCFQFTFSFFISYSILRIAFS